MQIRTTLPLFSISIIQSAVSELASYIDRYGFAHALRSPALVQVKMEERRCVVEKVGPCVVIRLISENKENRINPRFFEEYNSALDQAEK